LALPNLAKVIKDDVQPMLWSAVIELLVQYSGYEIYGAKGKYYPNRIKQWLKYLSRQYPQAKQLFTQVRTLRCSDDIIKVLKVQSE
ncbi:MAG: tRNA dihydrouridine(16) synthase DusC, partial [Algicola sp.]|nr:tRNA dihydrouridine(16) synthase DusC [Algicola sp.]